MRPALKKSATVIGVAAVLALTANGISYATNGHSLIAGHQNTATRTTTIKKSKPGPALSLISKGQHLPSFAVSSAARIPHLNASLLGGQTATSLSSNAINYVVGKAPHRQFTAQATYTLNIAAGVYDVSFDAVIIPSAGTPAAPTSVECGVYSSDFTVAYASSTTLFTGDLLPQLSGDSVVRIPPGGALFVCGTTAASGTFFQPASASFVKVNTLTARRGQLEAKKSQPRSAYAR